MTLAKTTVIYVDDDEDDRMFMQDVLSAKPDVELRIFASGAELFRYLSQQSPAVGLVLLDMNMPEQNGLQILQRLRSEAAYAAVPVVMLTTGSNSLEAQTLAQSGLEVVDKPSSLSALQAVVDRLLLTYR